MALSPVAAGVRAAEPPELLIVRDRFRLTRQDEAMHNSRHGRTMQNTFRITMLLAYMLKQIDGKMRAVLRTRITQVTDYVRF
jgi:hypothetical protein